MELALCTGGLSYWNRNKPSSNLCHKVRSTLLSKISVFAAAKIKIFDDRSEPPTVQQIESADFEGALYSFISLSLFSFLLSFLFFFFLIILFLPSVNSLFPSLSPLFSRSLHFNQDFRSVQAQLSLYTHIHGLSQNGIDSSVCVCEIVHAERQNEV